MLPLVQLSERIRVPHPRRALFERLRHATSATSDAHGCDPSGSGSVSARVLKWGSALVLRGGDDTVLFDLVVFLRTCGDHETMIELVGALWLLESPHRTSQPDAARRLRALVLRLAALDGPSGGHAPLV